MTAIIDDLRTRTTTILNRPQPKPDARISLEWFGDTAIVTIGGERHSVTPGTPKAPENIARVILRDALGKDREADVARLAQVFAEGTAYEQLRRDWLTRDQVRAWAERQS